MHKIQEAHFMKEILIRLCNLSQNKGLKNYQSGGNLKKGEVHLERGSSDPIGHYAQQTKAI